MVGILVSFWNGPFSGAVFVSGRVYTLIVSLFCFEARQLPFFYTTKTCVFFCEKKVELKKLEAENAARFGPGNRLLEGMAGPLGNEHLPEVYCNLPETDSELFTP